VGVTKVSLSIDDEVLAEARRRAGRRGLSSYVSTALQRQLQSDRIGQLLEEMTVEAGPVDPAALDEARQRWRRSD